MTRWTAAWGLWFLAFLVIEVLAYRSGGYPATLSGTVRSFMLLHHTFAIVVLGGLFGLIVHLLVDYLAAFR